MVRKNGMTHIFHAGGALTPDYPYYVRRNADNFASKIYNTPVKDYNYKYISVIAPRQMGKTSFLHRLASEMRKERWTCCYITLDAIRGSDPAEWFEYFGQELMRCMGYEGLPALRGQSDFRTLLLDQIGVGREDLATRLALFLDEVEALEDCPASDEFLLCLRAIYNVRFEYPGKLMAVFAGSTDTTQLVKNPRVSPFNVAESLGISDFQEDEANELTQHLNRLKIPVEEGVHRRIFEWTSGHPYLTQRICELLERRALSGIKEIRVADIDYIVEEHLIRVDSKDSNIVHIVRQASNAGQTTQNLLKDVLNGKKVFGTRLGTYALSLTGIVAETKGGYYEVRNKIYKEVLKEVFEPPNGDPPPPPRNQVFISYSHRDAEWLERVQIALRPEFRGTNIIVWDDEKIPPGDDWEDEINEALASAKVGILLVSMHFAASDFIYEKELPIILKAAQSKELRLVWIAVGPSDYRKLGLAPYQCANDPAKPLKSLMDSEIDDSLVKIADFVRRQFD
jgi:hypothetical protein